MGIKGKFYNFLSKQHPTIFRRVKFNPQDYKSIAVDVSIYLNKYRAVYAEEWKVGFSKFLTHLKNFNITIYCVFDGIIPVEKSAEQEIRRQNRLKMVENIIGLKQDLIEYQKTLKITKALAEFSSRVHPSLLYPEVVDVKFLTEHLNHMLTVQTHKFTLADYVWIAEQADNLGFVGISSLGEAEKLCAQLCHNKVVDAVLSDDSDLFAYLCPIIITKFNFRDNMCTIIKIDEVLRELNMSSLQFLDFCICCGTDYNPNIPKISVARALQYMQTYNSIEEFEEKTEIDTSPLNYLVVRKLFTI